MIALKMTRGKNQGRKEREGKKVVKRHLSGGTGRVTIVHHRVRDD